MTVTGAAAWRSPALGPVRELRLPGGVLRCHDTGVGPPVVLVHGVLSNANVWREVVQRLAPRLRCITLDLPLGAHIVPVPGADRTPPGVADLVADAIGALQLGPVTLVGNDTGGAICQLVVARRPEVIDRLMLTSCEFRDNWPPPMFRVMNPLARVPGGLVAYLAPGLLPRMDRAPVAYGWLAKRPFPRHVARSYTRPALLDPGVRADLAGFLRDYGRNHGRVAAQALLLFERPTLIAWSREDRIMPPAHGAQIAREMPDAELVWIDDAYTLSPEDQPGRVSELVAGFATQGLGSGGPSRVEANVDVADANVDVADANP